MFKANFTPNLEVEANTNIPMNVVFATNPYVLYNPVNATVGFLKIGKYDIGGHIVVTNVAENEVGLQILADGNVLAEATSTASTASTTAFATLPIDELLKVAFAQNFSIADISFRFTVPATIVNGLVKIKEVR